MEKKDLTISSIERQNILNNRLAVEALQERMGLAGFLFDGEYRYTKKMIAEFYGIEERTIERYLKSYSEELAYNGYYLCKGKKLKEFKLQFAPDANVGSKTRQLGLFNFRSFLNLGMLLQESQRAQEVRSIILDIVITTINEQTGGGTKYINRRDTNYLYAAVQEENYHRKMTAVIGRCVSGHKTNKYAQVTDIIYKAVFKENAKEYRQILKLDSEDSVRKTLYAEVLLVISSFENGVATAIEEKYQKEGRQITLTEVGQIVDELSNHPMQQPYINDARTKMASRDLGFREAFHENIAEYLRAVTPEEFERFIGNESIDFDAIIEGNKDVLNRLKMAE